MRGNTDPVFTKKSFRLSEEPLVHVAKPPQTNVQEVTSLQLEQLHHNWKEQIREQKEGR